MGIKYISSTETENGLQIVAETSELKINIDLEKITAKTTRISVDARNNIVVKDKSTAAAIIQETEAMLKKG
jgi:microsomal dipeptidase-like Zn-dependent dipeptidase